MTKPSTGRLVWNHSTHIAGLIPILERLCKNQGIYTVTPGVLGRVKGHSPHFQLRISVAIRGGFKVIARHGKSVQEVFIITDLQREQLEAIIQVAIAK